MMNRCNAVLVAYPSERLVASRANCNIIGRYYYPIFLFAENELLNHLNLLEPLSDAEKNKLNANIKRRHFQAGEQLLTQGMEVNSAHFVFSGIIQVIAPGRGWAGTECEKAGTR